jgi:hypothetical protein
MEEKININELYSDNVINLLESKAAIIVPIENKTLPGYISEIYVEYGSFCNFYISMFIVLFVIMILQQFISIKPQKVK